MEKTIHLKIHELVNKPDFEMAMNRINAWYAQTIIDRPPIRFTAHNADFSEAKMLKGKSWPDLKSKWFDAEFQVDYYIESIKGQIFRAETFPVFWPNLGPEVYSAFYGCELEYKEVTSYCIPFVKDWEDMKRLRFDENNEYLKKIEELTRIALGKCDKIFMVGYTDLHPGIDCAAAFRDPQQLCMDMMVNPEKVKELIRISSMDFQSIYNRFDKVLKEHNQLSVTWMGIPSSGKMHIPSCDFAAMISKEQFDEFIYPGLKEDIRGMDHNIFHVDGKGVAKNIDRILELPEINAIQWVQGMGDDKSIMQWIPFIQKCQKAGKSLVIDLELNELEGFIQNMKPEGILLCIPADEDIQPDIIKRINKW
jgi:hypothetical protein